MVEFIVLPASVSRVSTPAKKEIFEEKSFIVSFEVRLCYQRFVNPILGRGQIFHPS